RQELFKSTIQSCRQCVTSTQDSSCFTGHEIRAPISGLGQLQAPALQKQATVIHEDPKEQYEKGLQLFNNEKYFEAFTWLQKAADQGNAGSQVRLGLMYALGKGVHADETEAVAWLRKSADQGDADGQYYLGKMYANGRGVPKDDQQALQWYRQAADQGSEDAKAELERIGVY
ncbi:MAG: tetratricopeptide repeat protein, partial [Methylobacter sp.]|nr:tetratricopeptide repeat protein [Candidatus Methylobacter titanis]